MCSTAAASALSAAAASAAAAAFTTSPSKSSSSARYLLSYAASLLFSYVSVLTLSMSPCALYRDSRLSRSLMYVPCTAGPPHGMCFMVTTNGAMLSYISACCEFLWMLPFH